MKATLTKKVTSFENITKLVLTVFIKKIGNYRTNSTKF